jgi:hypothetical protein
MFGTSTTPGTLNTGSTQFTGSTQCLKILAGICVVGMKSVNGIGSFLVNEYEIRGRKLLH